MSVFSRNLSVTGCVASNYADNCVYIATSLSGLYMYDGNADEFVNCGDIPPRSKIVGISNVKYNQAGDSHVFIASVTGYGTTEGINNEIFVETGKNAF